MDQVAQIPVDPNAVVQGLSDRLAGATLENVQLRVVLAARDAEIASLKAAQSQDGGS